MSVRATTGVVAGLRDMRDADKPTDLLRVLDASEVTTDEAGLPWVTARLVIDAPTDVVAARLQPGQPYVLAFGTTSWTWNLIVTSYAPRTDGTVELQLASFDTRLLTYTPIAVDRTCWTMQADVNAIWRYVVGKVFGSAPGDDGLWDVQRTDADVPVTPFRTYSAVTNLHPNPVVTTLAGFTAYSSAGSTGATLFQSTGSALGNAARATGASGSLTSIDIRYAYSTTTGINVEAGKKYSASVSTRADNAATTGQLFLQYTDANNNVLASRGVNFNFNGFTYVRVKVTDTVGAPLGTVGVQLILRRANGSNGNYHDGAAWMVVEGDGKDTDATADIPPFSGDTTNGLNGYNYAWQGTAGQSASTRTPVLDRDPESLTWKPGQSAYEFLEPILQTLGLRTFAYAQYEYGLPAGSGASGPFTIQPLLALTTYQYSRRLYYTPIPDNQFAITSGVNLYDIDVQTAIGAEFPDGTPMYADAVVLHYTWTDSTGAAREAYDAYSFAATFLAPYVVEYPDTPFPGRGRALNLYRRLVARRRLITVTHRLRERIEPGVLLTVTDPSLGGSGSVLGYVDSTSHDLTAGVSVTRIKDAVDYPTFAWLRQPAGKSWNAVPAGTSWNTFTP